MQATNQEIRQAILANPGAWDKDIVKALAPKTAHEAAVLRVREALARDGQPTGSGRIKTRMKFLYDLANGNDNGSQVNGHQANGNGKAPEPAPAPKPEARQPVHASDPLGFLKALGDFLDRWEVSLPELYEVLAGILGPNRLP